MLPAIWQSIYAEEQPSMRTVCPERGLISVIWKHITKSVDITNWKFDFFAKYLFVNNLFAIFVRILKIGVGSVKNRSYHYGFDLFALA